MVSNLGLNGTETDPNPAGMGYVVIPSNIERELYIKSVYKNNAIMVRTEDGNIFRNVAVVSDVLERLIFPKTDEGFGSMVVFVNMPKYNNKVVVGIVDLLSEASRIISENQYKISQISEKSVVSTMHDADSGEVNISASALQQGVKTKVNISVTNQERDAEMNVFVAGQARIHASKNVILVANDNILVSVEDDKNKQLFNLKYKKGEGLTVFDEFENKMIFEKERILFYNSTGGKTIEMNEKGLSFGSKDKSAEKSVLGDTLKTLLEEFIDCVKGFVIPSPVGPLKMNPKDVLKLNEIKLKLDNCLSKINTLD